MWYCIHTKVTLLLKFEEVADRETTNLKQHFNECFDFIDEAKRNGGHVLVHRKMGISRR